MPQITKIRIVNFVYNGGKSLIPDELFDLSSADTGEALNTLFECKNAGGKSILTQLIMQPIKPKAVAAKRRIENFFEFAGQHSYVVLEWNLDNSKEKLLTGISITASSNNSKEDDDEKENSINYYTFTTRYDSFSAYSISNLELSSNVDGKYVPASFDYIREKAKASRGILTYYSSKEARKWTEYLAEYGIYRQEWENVIEELNKEEGGVSDKFKDTETSNSLINKFLIPAIEKKMKNTASKDNDSSLKTMLINYAKKIADKDNVLKQHDTNKSLLMELETLNEASDALYNANSEYITSITEAKGFVMAINRKKRDVLTEKDDIKRRQEEQKTLIAHIKHENVSKDFYNAIDEHKKALSDKEEALKLLEESKDAVKAKKHEEDILRCAKLYRDIRKNDNNITEINHLIDEKENKSEDAERIANLKYSTFVKAKEAEVEQNVKKDELEEKISKKTVTITDCEKAKKKSEESYRKAESKYHQASSSLTEAKLNTDMRVKSLQIEAIRKLTGFYSADELDSEKSIKLRSKKEQEDKLSVIDTRIEEINERNIQIPQEIFILQNDQKEISRLKDETIESIKQYDALFERISKICEKYSYESTAAFKGILRDVIRRDIEETEADITTKKHKHESLNEKKKAAEFGYLHILPEIMTYVSSTGINVTTGEEYICGQIEAGTISSDKANEILHSYPELAYSLLFSNDKDIQKLLSAGNIDWLPAAVPLFTMTQIVSILDGTLDTSAYLTAIDRNFFTDRNGYIVNLKGDIESLEERMEQLSNRVKEEKEELSIAEQFTYEEGWKKVQEDRVASYDTQICNIGASIKALETEKKDLQSELLTLKDKEKKCNKAINEIYKWLSSFDELSEMVKNEQAKYTEEQDSYIAMNKAKSNYEQKCKLFESHKEELALANAEYESIKTLLKEIRTIIEGVNNAKTATLIEGEYKSLYEQYKAYQLNMNNDLEGLRVNLDSLLKDKQENENALASYNCSEGEYTNPSLIIEILPEVMNHIKELEVVRDTKQKEYTDVNGRLSASEAKVEHSKRDLEDYGGEPLPKNEIGDNFRTRITKAKENISILMEKYNKLDDEEHTLNNIVAQINNISEVLSAVDTFKDIVLRDNPDEQWSIVKKELMLRKKECAELKAKFSAMVLSIITEYKDSAILEIINKLKNINAMVEDDTIKGDRLFTASESISAMIDSITKINSKIETDLKDITNEFDNLAYHCFLQGRRICEDLRIIANSSKAHIFDDKTEQIQMIKLGLPSDKELSEEASKVSIRNEIEKGANEIKMMMVNNVEWQYITSKAEKIVSSERLLHKYLMRESIPVKVYVINLNSANSHYQQWEETFMEGKNKASGAQKFVIYFSVIASLMNYSRSASGVVNKDVKSVLLMDNPYGRITTKELLKPLFMISKRFNIQIISLSDIDKSEVSNSHDCNIVIRHTSNRLGDLEIMTHNDNEKIEHGFYKIMNRQIKLS